MAEQKFSINKIDAELQLPWWSLQLGNGKEFSDKHLSSESNVFWDASAQSNGNQYSSNMLILGYSGSGKTNMVKNIVNQLANRNVKVIINCAPVHEYNDFMNKRNFKVNRSSNIEEVLDDLSFVEYKIQSLYDFMATHNLTKLPTSGEVTLNEEDIIIEDCYISPDTKIITEEGNKEISSLNLEEYIDKEIVLENYNSVAKFELNKYNWQKGGNYKFKPVFIIFDDAGMYLNGCLIDELEQEFMLIINHIMTIGHKVNVHVVMSTMWVDSIISNGLMKYFDMVCVCGKVDEQYSIKAVGGGEATCVPDEKGYCLISDHGDKSITVMASAK